MAQPYHPPATQRHYDACVIGSQVGGAVAAALLARRGFRVLEVDHDGHGAGYVDGGWILPWRPAPLPSPLLMPAGLSALGEIGAANALGRALRPLPGGLQLLLPRARLELPDDPGARAAELRREWPGEHSALEAALAALDATYEDGNRLFAAAPALPPRGLFGRWALRRAVAKAASPGREPPDRARPLEPEAGHPLGSALLSLVPFLSSLDGPPPPFAVGRLLGGALRGLHTGDGGGHALREVIRHHGAHGLAEHEATAAARGVVEAVEVSGRRVQGVRLAGSPDLHGARVVVLATAGAPFARLLPRGAARAAAALGRLRPQRRILAINFVVRAAALPPPLGPAALVALGGEAVLLEVVPARRTAPAEGGPGEATHVLCAAAAVPAEPFDRAAVVEAAGRIRAAVAEAIPFFDRHVVFESIPALAGAGEGEPFPDAADPLYAPVEGAALGVAGLPVKGPFSNLFLASREVLPGLGLEGEIYAGIQAAAHAASALGHKDRPTR